MNNIVTKQTPDENIAKSNLKEFSQSQELKRIKTKNEKQSFRERLKALKRFALISIILLLIWSGTTESLFLYAGFYETSSSITASIIFTLLVVILIEGGKIFFGTFALLFLTQGWIKDGLLYLLTYLILLPTTIGIYYGSYYLSVNGAPQIASFIHKQTASPTLIDTDSINQEYDRKVSLIQSKIDSSQNIKWKGVTTKSATKLSIAFQEQINKLENLRENEVQNAFKTNQETKEDNSLTSHSWGIWLSRFGGYGELLTIVFLLFSELYDRASYLELPLENNHVNKDNNVNNHDVNESSESVSDENQDLVQHLVYDETSNEPELQKIRDLIKTQKVDARYLKQRAKQCFKRSFKEQSLEQVKTRNLKKAMLFVNELASIGIKTVVNPKDETDLIFVENA